MQTTIKEVSPVERELEVNATAEDLAPELKRALRAQRSQTQMKGFRQGKVPLSLVKKMYGKALGAQVAERFVQDAYEREVVEPGELDVLGQAQMTELDYEIDGDLRAVIRFAVRPEVELEDLSGEEILKLRHEVTDEEVEEEIEQLRRRRADLTPKEEEGAEEEDYVLFDLQELDAETDTAIVGKRDEDQSMFLDSPQIETNPMLGALKDALLEKKPGDTVRFNFEHAQAHGEHAEGTPHRHRFEATVKEVKRRDLPALDDEFVQEVTEGEVEDVEAFRAEVRRRLEAAWAERSRELLQGQIVERMLALHPVPVPEAVVDVYLDSFVEDVKQQGDGKLPENFDEAHFRNQNRDEARQQAHWMLVRDRVVEEHGLEVTDEDVQAFFGEQAEGEEGVTAAQLQQFYRSMPQLMEQVEQRVLSQKVFDVLAEQFDVVEKEREAFEQAFDRRAEAAAGEEGAEGAPSPLVKGQSA